MAMSRRDYERIALAMKRREQYLLASTRLLSPEIQGRMRGTHRMAVTALSNMFAVNYANFDEDKFLHAALLPREEESQ